MSEPSNTLWTLAGEPMNRSSR